MKWIRNVLAEAVRDYPGQFTNFVIDRPMAVGDFDSETLAEIGLVGVYAREPLEELVTAKEAGCGGCGDGDECACSGQAC